MELLRLPFENSPQTFLEPLHNNLNEPTPLSCTGMKPPMTVLGECRVMWDLLIETQTREPAPGQVHAQLFHQLALAGNAVQITQKQNAQQKLGINGRKARIAVTRFQLFGYEGKTDVRSSWNPKVSSLASQNESLPRKVFPMVERSHCSRGCSQPKSFPRSSMRSPTKCSIAANVER
jgi:hypothetical protein